MMAPSSSTAQMSKSRRILAYGDSLTAGYTGFAVTHEYAPWAPHVAAALGVPIDHVGMSGWTTKQMLDNQHSKACVDVCGEQHPGLSWLLRDKVPSTVLIMAGTNDLGVAEPEQIFANLKQLHEICHRAGADTVALSVPQSEATTVGPQWVAERRRGVNALLSQYAEQTGTLCTYLAMDTEVPWSAGSPDYEPDGLHMTERGYKSFAEALAPKLKEVAVAALSPDKAE